MTTQKQWDRWFFNKWAAGEIHDQRDDVAKGGSAAAKMFNDIIKADVSDPLRGPRDEDDSLKVETKLRAWAKLMVTVDPTRSEEEHLHRMTSTAHGRSLALHLNEISKKENTPMDIHKLMPAIEILEEGLMKQATINKREGETDAKAFARKYENDLDFRKSWANISEMKQFAALSKSVPQMMSTTPVSTEVGSTLVADDSMKAAAQLSALAEKQHALSPTLTRSQIYDLLYADPENRDVIARAHPLRSSPSYDALINA